MEEFLKLWDDVLSQDGVEGIYIVAFRGSLPVVGQPWDVPFLGTETEPMAQLKETLAWLKANPYEPDKPKRGRKKKV